MCTQHNFCRSSKALFWSPLETARRRGIRGANVSHQKNCWLNTPRMCSNATPNRSAPISSSTLLAFGAKLVDQRERSIFIWILPYKDHECYLRFFLLWLFRRLPIRRAPSMSTTNVHHQWALNAVQTRATKSRKVCFNTSTFTLIIWIVTKTYSFNRNSIEVDLEKVANTELSNRAWQRLKNCFAVEQHWLASYLSAELKVLIGV